MLAGIFVFALLPPKWLQIIRALFIAAVIPLRRWAAQRNLRLERRAMRSDSRRSAAIQ